jgi:hypothetical protein
MNGKIIMPQEPNNLIIGATISFISVTLTFILTSVYNWLEKNRERKWIIEDRRYHRRLEVLSVRLKEVEDYVNQLFDIAEKLVRYEFQLFQTKKADKVQEFYKDFTQIILMVSRKKSSVLNLNDEELANLSKEFADYVLAELDIVTSLENKIINNEIIEDEIESKRVSDFFAKTMNLRKLVIRRIDHLSGFQN